MKKFNLLLLACFALIATTSKATDWPSNYSFDGSTGYGYSSAPMPDEYTQLEAEAVSLSDGVFTMPTAGDDVAFDDVYFSIDNEYELSKLRADAGARQENDTFPAYKVGYDSEAFYVFLTYSHKDNATLNKDFKTEVMFCSYDRLEYNEPVLLPNEGVLWLRYLVLGGVKVDAANKNGSFVLGNYMGTIDDGSSFTHEDKAIAGSRYEPYVSIADYSTSTAMKFILKLKFAALDNRIDPENVIPFTLDAWKAACEEKGITFEIKLTFDNNNTDGPKRSFMWNHTSNNSYFSNAYAGYLAPAAAVVAYDITVDGGTANPVSAEEGATVTVTADVPDGKLFIRWESEDDITFADANAAETTFTMPAKDVTVTAVYQGIGIEEGAADAIALYPNPATDYIMLNGIAEGAYTIANAAGATIFSGVYQGNAINISSLLQGLYFISIGNSTMPFVKK